MMIRNVGKTVSKLMLDNGKDLGVKPNPRYLRYLMLQFDANYIEDGRKAVRDVLDKYADQEKYPPGEIATMKLIAPLDKDIESMFAGYAGIVDREQADFLRVLVYQDRDYIDEHGLEAMRKVAQSYGG